MSKRLHKMQTKIIDLLIKATTSIIDLMKQGKTQDCINILCDCQESAIELGNSIENVNGMNTQTVKELEKYCELVYQTVMKIQQENKICNDILDCIKNVKVIYDKEFEEKLEVVFLPYKSSMWDSMESIWLEANGDDGCDAYVVPIPYYDRNSDTSFGEMHWEGDKYPDSVRITRYDEYDIEKHQPDVIFIHNPYDENNYITSVHPDFYSSKLRNYTDNVIYVPYYILPGPPQEVDESFVLVSGVGNANKVFVQNEEVREFYIKTLCKYVKEVPSSIWENKIVAIGSPKTDKIINMDKEKLTVPSEWLSAIEGKKVIFFNTNVSLLLKNPEHIIDNLKRIFSIINKRPQFAVIWREHPLTMSTLSSMRTDIKEDYLKLRKQFIEEKWGVMDETPEPHLAMALSDCYYGAGGSLTAIYPVTGKPVMMMDYLYPNQTSNEVINIEELISKATCRMLYTERNINSLELFLDNIDLLETQKEERISKQSIRMDNLDGTVGKKIYEYVKQYYR